jgi:hypothetical protein
MKKAFLGGLIGLLMVGMAGTAWAEAFDIRTYALNYKVQRVLILGWSVMFSNMSPEVEVRCAIVQDQPRVQMFIFRIPPGPPVSMERSDFLDENYILCWAETTSEDTITFHVLNHSYE